MRFVLLLALVGFARPSLAQPTLDLAVAQWQQSHNQRNAVLYEALLDAEYVFLPTADDAATLGPTLDRERDLQATSALFGGEPSPGGQGSPVVSIAVVLTPTNAWTAEAEGEFAGTQSRVFGSSATIRFFNQEVVQITTFQVFYMVGIPNGTGTVYRLRAWRELPVDTKAEETTWGRLKFIGTGVANRAESMGSWKARFRP